MACTRCGNRVAVAPLGPYDIVDPLQSDLDQPLFSSDMVTHEVEPQAGALQASLPSAPPPVGQCPAAHDPPQTVCPAFLSCLWPRCRAGRVFAPPAGVGSGTRHYGCCFPPAGWSVLEISQVPAEAIGATSYPVHANSSSHGRSWFIGNAGVLFLLAAWLYAPLAFVWRGNAART